MEEPHQEKRKKMNKKLYSRSKDQQQVLHKSRATIELESSKFVQGKPESFNTKLLGRKSATRRRSQSSKISCLLTMKNGSRATYCAHMNQYRRKKGGQFFFLCLEDFDPEIISPHLVQIGEGMSQGTKQSGSNWKIVKHIYNYHVDCFGSKY